MFWLVQFVDLVRSTKPSLQARFSILHLYKHGYNLHNLSELCNTKDLYLIDFLV